MNCVIADILQSDVAHIQGILQEENINLLGVATDKTELYIILKNADVDFLIISKVFLEQTVNYKVEDEIRFYFPNVKVVKYCSDEGKESIIKQLGAVPSSNTPPIPFN